MGLEISRKTGKKIPARWWIFGGLALALAVVIVTWAVIQAQPEQPKEAPEAQQVLELQANMPFQILIPAYLPKDFIRAKTEITVNQAGPGDEPLVEIVYRTRRGETIYIREWVPVNPELEILAGSRPIETSWGPGWLLRQGEDLMTIWVDIGPLRVAIFTYDQNLIDQQHLLAVAENMGPASNQQVFSFVVNPSQVKEVQPPPPVVIPVGEDGVQAVDLIVTPGGYSPLRFAVKKGVPVRLIFRQLGEVGCGNELNFPVSATNMTFVRLESASDKQVIEFTPPDIGTFQFYCGHLMYRGEVTVTE